MAVCSHLFWCFNSLIAKFYNYSSTFNERFKYVLTADLVGRVNHAETKLCGFFSRCVVANLQIKSLIGRGRIDYSILRSYSALCQEESFANLPIELRCGAAKLFEAQPFSMEGK